MTDRLLRALLLAGLLSAAAPAAWAQQPQLSPEDEISPRQIQNVPASPRTPRAPRTRAVPAANPDTAATPAPAAAPGAPRAAPIGRTIACSGVFARDSNHLRLAQAVEAKNIEFGEVDGPEGSKLPATVIFPQDPKRRLEVLWQNDAARADISLIVIGGQSQWSGPKGLRLGLTLAALEKLNHKPFKLAGFDQPNGGSALDWQGGALASLPGGCTVGVRFKPDPKASPAVIGAAGGKELQSSDAAVRAAKPIVSEIILGYSQ